MLTYLPAGHDGGDLSEIRNGCLSNPDGFGWAIVSRKRIITGHSLDMDKALESFRTMRAKHLKGPAIFHSRYATHGSIKQANCHPFKVGGDRRVVMAHNGIMPTDCHPAKGDDRSDSKIFADELLPSWMVAIHMPQVRQALEQWLGHNKVVVLSTRHEAQAFILNEKSGTWSDSGLWHSNSDYLPMKWYDSPEYLASLSYGSTYRPYVQNECVMCYGITEDPDVCGACFTCRYCELMVDDDGNCGCLNPGQDFPNLARLALEESANDETPWWRLDETVDL